MTTTIGVSVDGSRVRAVVVAASDRSEAGRSRVVGAVRHVADTQSPARSVTPAVDEAVTAALEAGRVVDDVAVAYRTRQERAALVTALAGGEWRSASLVSARAALAAVAGDRAEFAQCATVLAIDAGADRLGLFLVDRASRTVLSARTWPDAAESVAHRSAGLVEVAARRPDAVLGCGSAADARVLDEVTAVLPGVVAVEVADAVAYGAALVAGSRLDAARIAQIGGMVAGGDGAAVAGAPDRSASEVAAVDPVRPVPAPRWPRPRRRLLLVAGVVTTAAVAALGVLVVAHRAPRAVEPLAGARVSTATAVPVVPAAPVVSPAVVAPPPAAPPPLPPPEPLGPPPAPPLAVPAELPAASEVPVPVAPPRPRPRNSAPPVPDTKDDEGVRPPAPVSPAAPAAPAVTQQASPGADWLFPGESPPPGPGADQATVQNWWGNHLQMKERWLGGR